MNTTANMSLKRDGRYRARPSALRYTKTTKGVQTKFAHLFLMRDMVGKCAAFAHPTVVTLSV